MRAEREISRIAAGRPAADELSAVAATVDRVCRQAIDPRVERPEQILPAAELAAISAGAREVGILPDPGAPGYALWEGESLAPALASLARLGQSCAGVAFHLHRVSLATFIARQLGLDVSTRPALHLGNVDWADSTPRLDGEPLLVHGALDWDELWLPAADAGWLRLPRAALGVVPVEGQHGLDEVRVWEVQVGAAPAVVARGEGRLLAHALAISALGMVAIGLGAARHGLRLAHSHAGSRRQGGALLREHPAVQNLLGEAAAAIATVASALRGVESLPADAAALAQLLGMRTTAHRLLCESANASLQVLGGMGYMRDAGTEKIVRDLNHLRLLEGSPAELWRFLARTGDVP